MNMYTKLAFMFGFVALVVGGLIFSTSLIEFNQASELDAGYESLPLQHFVEKNYDNKHLFELTDVRAGDDWSPYYDDRSNKLIFAWVPLYRADQADDDGTRIRVIAQVCNVNTQQQLLDAIKQKSFKVQYWEEDPAYASNLQGSYPELDLSNVVRVSIDAPIPNQSTALIYIIGSGLGVVFGFSSWAFAGSLAWRKFRAKRRPYEIQLAEAQERPIGYDDKVEPWINKIQPLGKICIIATPVLVFCNIAVVFAGKGGWLPAEVSNNILMIGGPLFLLSILVGFAIQFLNQPIIKIEKRDKADVPEFALKLMNPNIDEFVTKGFTLLGFSERRYLEHKWAASLISADQLLIAEITVNAKNKTVTVGATGIADSGMLVSYSRAPVEIKIEGMKIGLPMYAQISEHFTNEHLLEGMQQTRNWLQQNGMDFSKIDAKDVFHVVDYEAILADWWAYRESMRLIKPAPVPMMDDVVKTKAEIAQFIFNNREELCNAFESERRVVDSLESMDEPERAESVFPLVGGMEPLASDIYSQP